MSLRPPKTITSAEGLGINTSKKMLVVSERISIGTETWHEMKEPWKQGGIIIAKPGYSWVTKWELGKPYIITKFLDATADLIAVYCDVSRPVQKLENGFSFTDIYLDVWQIPGEEPSILDENELAAAVQAKYISPEEATTAHRIAENLVNHLKNDRRFLKF